MKLTKKIMSVFLVLLLTIISVAATSVTTANAASKTPVFTINNVSGLTYNNAKISAHITNPNNTNISRAGFQIGTASNRLTTTKYDKINKAHHYIDVNYLMSKYKVSLKANTTYYYRFFINTGNKNYYSPVKSFKTKPDVPTISYKSVSDLTYNNATINGTMTNPKNITINRIGFQVGTSKDKLTTNKYYNFNNKGTSKSLSFKMSSYKVTLKANTTYYYRIYVTSGSKTYYGSVQNFKTKSDTPTISYSSVSGVSYNNATINGTMTNLKNVTINRIGFQLGTSKDRLTTNKYYNFNNKGTSKSLSFKMSSYKVTLKANTTYYYRIYVTSGSKTYCGSVQSFRTPQKITATKICFPLSTNQVWYASTYVGHGGENASAYSSVDITLKNGKSSRGYAVYAVEEGTVVSDDNYLKSINLPANGQIVIKHTKTLITTNGKKYSSWYSIYAHMSNISVKNGSRVKRGQQIGKVSDVGKATGPHLHFSISSALNGTSWYQTSNREKAISPYYVYGFVNENGSNTSYCVCDRKGTGVTNQLINWKPTGK